MVMTRRQRAPPPQKPPSPPPESESEPETKSGNKRARVTKRKPPAPPPKSESESEPETKTKTRSGNKRARVTKRKPPSPTSSSSSESEIESESEAESENEYEKRREQRMKENRERMQKLGIFALSSQFNGIKKAKAVVAKKKRAPPVFPRNRSSDYRRSDRLRDTTHETKNELVGMGITIPDSWKSEVYTEEHAKLLGSCETEWTLNVDGFGEEDDGLYDTVNGKSCHQCRQKTVRKHTSCIKCRSLQGQLCGDCLYTRYGENVVETTQNPNWMCPACRDICNCSRCRRDKGWPPVNILHQKVIESGFKSVAHYLILTRRPETLTNDSNEQTPTIDLTQTDTQEPLRYKGSDTSADWAESEDDDDSDDDDNNSKTQKKNSTQSDEIPVNDTEPPNEPVDGVDENQGISQMTTNDDSVILLL